MVVLCCLRGECRGLQSILIGWLEQSVLTEMGCNQSINQSIKGCRVGACAWPVCQQVSEQSKRKE